MQFSRTDDEEHLGKKQLKQLISKLMTGIRLVLLLRRSVCASFMNGDVRRRIPFEGTGAIARS